ncbi:NAD(P)-dependent alcohol dehydrogenase [Rhizobium rosettiformans]|uniref:NAD(P)-dependent alcohol dehydrogenase n=1 Tax=Rhizobium rosettiformans TaxID=1368430 RepID=UPI0028641FB3|nr:NAD(P)-dependent alcohol dehydrogenase [Rhizobium rosettiformans]MDR7031159.1 putative zinc-type alcohol dehydrogenase-like protein [Rhizobium rosettiformans]MDR7066724.1 putative zinc-type alcohol dehydrogenase-like protein [Rhizobium rosettiformans]
MFRCHGYAAASPKAPLAPFSFERREPGPNDIQIEILYCGVCHSDLHRARNEWGGTIYPCVPGHEMVGRITAVGSAVTKFKVGDTAGVGVMVDSCQRCENCKDGLQQFCEVGQTETYNSPDKHTGGHTYGGYSSHIVVDETFVLRIPEGMDLAAVAPLLCAGITTYSPLRHWKVGPGQKVGVVGLGGLGHLGVKIAAALGANVVLFTTSLGKSDDAKRLGVKEVVLSTDADAMARHANSFDFILDTVSANHDINGLLQLLRRDGTLTQVGVPVEPQAIHAGTLVGKRRNYAGSTIGGVAETQEMLEFCARHGIVSDIELIAIHQVNDAFERMLRSDVKYRFVIDMATLPAA